MSIKIALAGNPNCGKTTLFNALTGSNQFVGNWPGVTVEKKEGKLKKHSDVIITDLPGIYSLSPYTLEEVVARNYLINEHPDAVLNIVDGTNLERNLYLTTQVVELGIPVVVAVNMMDIVRKNGDKINIEELSRQLACPVVEISALKGTGIKEAADLAVKAASDAPTIPQHKFSGVVEHALAHIEEAVLHDMPENQQRWYAIKIFEGDDKVLSQLNIPSDVLSHIQKDIKAAEDELDDDAESIITNERYVYIASIIHSVYKKKSHDKLSTSDKIDKVVTNRWLGLPIFAVIMFLVYYISMVTVGAAATDWTNDGLFGDGYHLFGNGTAAYEEASKEYGDTDQILDAFISEYGTDEMADAIDLENEDYSDATAKSALGQLVAATPSDAKVTYETEDMRIHHIKRATALRIQQHTVFGLTVFLFFWAIFLKKQTLRNGFLDFFLTVLLPVSAQFLVSFLKCSYCSSFLHSLRLAVICQESHSFSTVSSESSAFRVNRSFLCLSVQAAVSPALWHPVQSKMSVTVV